MKVKVFLQTRDGPLDNFLGHVAFEFFLLVIKNIACLVFFPLPSFLIKVNQATRTFLLIGLDLNARFDILLLSFSVSPGFGTLCSGNSILTVCVVLNKASLLVHSLQFHS